MHKKFSVMTLAVILKFMAQTTEAIKLEDCGCGECDCDNGVDDPTSFVDPIDWEDDEQPVIDVEETPDDEIDEMEELNLAELEQEVEELNDEDELEEQIVWLCALPWNIPAEEVREAVDGSLAIVEKNSMNK